MKTETISISRSRNVTIKDSFLLLNEEQHLLMFYSFFVLQVETELIDKLDILVSENKGDQEYKHLFNTM